MKPHAGSLTYPSVSVAVYGHRQWETRFGVLKTVFTNGRPKTKRDGAMVTTKRERECKGFLSIICRSGWYRLITGKDRNGIPTAIGGHIISLPSGRHLGQALLKYFCLQHSRSSAVLDVPMSLHQ